MKTWATSANWVLLVFVFNIVFQRFAVPGTPIPITFPLLFVMIGLGLAANLLELNLPRLKLWVLTAALSALIALPQLLWNVLPFLSFSSWAYWVTMWLPIAVHLRDRSKVAFDRCVHHIAAVGLWLGSLSVAFTILQLIGLPYRDWLVEWLPASILTPGYVISYPVTFDSTIYKSNAWLMLEPSFLSYTLGICAVCGIVSGASRRSLAVTLLGMFSTTAGSGFAVLLIAAAILAIGPRRKLLHKLAMPALLLVLLVASTHFGRSIVGRLGEASNSNSSTSLRAIQPYVVLWPTWTRDLRVFVLGHGAGSSNALVRETGVPDLLVPNIAKVLFDYGLFVGLLLIIVILITHLMSPEPVLAYALLFSLFTLQAAVPPLVLCSVALVSMWAPRPVDEPGPPDLTAGLARMNDSPEA